ncbi:MAG: hypothetical protein ACOX8X_00735 [Methanomethylophilus sp.]|jgi:hypothetical protein
MLLMHVRFLEERADKDPTGRYMRVYFRPKKWPKDRKHVRYITVYMDQPKPADAQAVVEYLCPGFSRAMDIIWVQTYDEYGERREIDAKTKKEISQAKEWEDDDHLLHCYQMREDF